GIERVQDILSGALEELGMTVERIRRPEYGSNVVARTPAPGARPLLMGHVDTVFPPDGSFQHFSRDDKHVYGPGVLDMKGGLVVIILALRVLKRMGKLSDVPITVYFNNDEEIGSPDSRLLLPDVCRDVDAGLVF